ncbi:hypothetical protein FRC12_006805 [Ceratobasidium sp. 428]|nr:hypothetical protein FRC12_006805 [Ceratobasidium sp. 428]
MDHNGDHEAEASNTRAGIPPTILAPHPEQFITRQTHRRQQSGASSASAIGVGDTPTRLPRHGYRRESGHASGSQSYGRQAAERTHMYPGGWDQDVSMAPPERTHIATPRPDTGEASGSTTPNGAPRGGYANNYPPNEEYEAEYEDNGQNSQEYEEPVSQVPSDLSPEAQQGIRIIAREAIQFVLDTEIFPALQDQSVAIAHNGKQLGEQAVQLDRLEGLLNRLVDQRAPQMPAPGPPRQAPSERSPRTLTVPATTGGIRPPSNLDLGSGSTRTARVAPITSTPAAHRAGRPANSPIPPVNLQRPAYCPIGDYRGRVSMAPLHNRSVVHDATTPQVNRLRNEQGATRAPRQSAAPGTAMRPLQMASPAARTEQPSAHNQPPRGGNPYTALRGTPDPGPGPVTRAAAEPAADPVPRAAGFPIGAAPYDRVSALIIRELTAHAGDDPDTRKNSMAQILKIQAPTAYSGETEATKFMDWVTKIARYCRLAGMWGPSHDRARVDLIGYCCDGAVLTWFNREVETCEGGPESWTTLEVIQGLQARFITQRSAAEAGKLYRKKKQEDLDVQEFYHELCALAQQLPDYPSQYEFNYRFLRGLRPDVANKVTDFCVSAEQNTTQEVLKAAIDAEAVVSMRRNTERDRAAAKVAGSSDSHRKFQSKDNNAAKATVTAVADKKGQASSSNTANKGGRRDRPATGNCFHCNQPGHKARDCPQSRTIAGKAAAVVQGDSDSESDRSDDNEAVPASQMTSDEDYEPDPNQGIDDSEQPSPSSSVWSDFNREFPMSGRACTIVPLDAEITACAATGQQAQPADILAPAARKKLDPSRVNQPVRLVEEQQPITGYYRIGGVVAHVMIDSGLGTNMISPEFVRAAGIRPIKLEQPVGLQLMLIGSRGKLNYRLNALTEIGETHRRLYYDVANINKYDAVLGLPFLIGNKASLDFGAPALLIAENRYPTGFRTDAAAKTSRTTAVEVPAASATVTITASNAAAPATSTKDKED